MHQQFLTSGKNIRCVKTSIFPGVFVGSDGFEPPKATPAELQSAPFGHSGNCPSVENDAKIIHFLHYLQYFLSLFFSPNVNSAK